VPDEPTSPPFSLLGDIAKVRNNHWTTASMQGVAIRSGAITLRRRSPSTNANKPSLLHLGSAMRPSMDSLFFDDQPSQLASTRWPKLPPSMVSRQANS
jgi:hypothetical protein